jgi:hypothetical protein
MRILYALGFMAAIIFVLVTSSVTGNAVVLYPWCAKTTAVAADMALPIVDT